MEEYLFFLIRISICFVLGIAIGVERQCRRKIAGIRTITLVSLGAFLFTSISHEFMNDDVTRIAAQVVSGIGFLGAGVILRDGANIKGLNTAATLWCSAAIGTLTALGLIIEAIIGVAYILLSNLLLRFISRKMIAKSRNNHRDSYKLVVVCTEEKEMIVKSTLMQKLKSNQFTVLNLHTKKKNDNVVIDLYLGSTNSDNDIDIIVNRACIEPGVISVEYEKIDKFTDDDDDDYEIK